MTPHAIITLTTDFGEGSPYVAQLKGAVLSIAPTVQLVDITHSIAAHNIRHGAIVLETVTPDFPDATIHVAVVDPGVGMQREIVYARIGRQHYIAPDNGLLGLLLSRFPCSRIVTINNPTYWNTAVSATFHGRDIMGPVAAHLSRGVPPDKLGTCRDELATLSWPQVARRPHELTGTVVAIDHFGNLLTDISRSLLPNSVAPNQFRVGCRGQVAEAWVDCYGQASPGMFVALIGSSDRLELAIVQGSAADRISAKVDDRVQVTWPLAGG